MTKFQNKNMECVTGMLSLTQDAMRKTGKQMNKVGNFRIRQHGKEMLNAAVMIKTWLDERGYNDFKRKKDSQK